MCQALSQAMDRKIHVSCDLKLIKFGKLFKKKNTKLQKMGVKMNREKE